MKLSCVTVSWNSADLAARLLASLENNPPRCTCEMIIVDNNSEDFRPGDFARPNVTAIPCSENYKYAKGNNIGIAKAQGEYILLVNPDIEFTEGSLDILADYLDNHPDTAAVCPRLILPDGTTDRSVRGFPYFLPLLLSYCHIPSSYMLSSFDYGREQQVLQPMTSSLLIRREALEELKGFDEDFPIFFNDVDMLYRAAAKGMKIMYLPSSRMKHIHGGSTKRADPRLMKRESLTSLVRFYKKHFTGRYTKAGVMLFALLISLITPKEP